MNYKEINMNPLHKEILIEVGKYADQFDQRITAMIINRVAM